MNTLIDKLNSVLTAAVDLINRPFQNLDPLVGLVVASILSGIVLVIIYGQVSNQRQIRRIKERIGALLLESIVFRHDTGVSLRAQVRMLGNALLYFLIALPPLFVLLVPCLLLLAQLNLYYGSRPLLVGEPALVEVIAKKPERIRELAVKSDDGMTISAAVRVPRTGSAVLKVIPREPGTHLLSLQIPGEESIQLEVNAGTAATTTALPTRGSTELLGNILYPGVASRVLAPTAFREFRVSYPERSYSVLGFKLHWIVVFFVVSLISGLLISRRAGVEL